MSTHNPIQTVYVVTHGEYDDYGIVAIFEDKVKAESFIEVCNKGLDPYSDPYLIEEWPVGRWTRESNAQMWALSAHVQISDWAIRWMPCSTVVDDLDQLRIEPGWSVSLYTANLHTGKRRMFEQIEKERGRP